MKPLSCAVLSMVISVALAIPKTTSAQTSHDADVHELERLETVWMELTSTVTSAMRNTMLSCMFSDLPFRYAAPHRSL